jgi:uncharacterized protein (DUF885 family)
MLRWLSMSVLLCLAWAAPFAAAVDASAESRAEAAFKALYLREWNQRMLDSPGLPDAEGKRRIADRLPDVSAESRTRSVAFWKSIRDELNAMDLDALSPASRIDARILRAQLDDAIANAELGSWMMPLNSDSSFFGNLAMVPAQTPLSTRDEAEAYLAWLADIPRYFAQQTDNMRKGLSTGMSVPRIVLKGRDATAALHAEVETPEQSVFFAPFRQLPERWAEDDREALIARARTTIVDKVQPAYAGLRDFLRTEYLPRAREGIAAHDLPDGKAWYRAQIREYTTLDLGADEIHAIGLNEVARIRAEMQTIIEGLAFKGSFADFLAFLRSDPQFKARTEDELLMRARDIAKRIDAELPRYFGTLPRRPYGVAPVPAEIAPYYTGGRYSGAPEGSNEPGWYWVNTWNLPARPLYTLPALTLHEAVPGHHLQAALAEEQQAQPVFRRNSYISAYGEGWALYAEYLGKEMGIYRTPYEQFGRLTYEMWRACRLVVDTGMHAKGWSRDRALEFMRSNTALSEHEIATEIDRYISWPGQALSYKLGEIRIRELRALAELELGERFDLRAFHDALLSLGSVPLSVLDAHMREWVKQRKGVADGNQG